MSLERYTPEIIAKIESSAVLSDIGIQYEREKRRIVIEPFKKELLSNSSYDLTLGENYFVKDNHYSKNINIYDQKAAVKIWGEPKKAKRVEDLKAKLDNLSGLADDDKVIQLPPRSMLLVHSEEFAGARENYTTMVRARSTIERLGILTAISAGWGDVGFINRWTFFLVNTFDNEVLLKVGDPYFQIVFLKCEPMERTYLERSGKYQETEDFAELASRWKPEDMLPKLNTR